MLILHHPVTKWSHCQFLLWWSHILSTTSIANCLRAYLSLLGFAGFSAQCLVALLGPRGANNSEGVEKELKRWERRRGTMSSNEMFSYKAVRATHLFIWGSLSSPACVAFLMPINTCLWKKTCLYIFKSVGSSSREESKTELGIIDVPLMIVWCVTVSGARRSITAAILPVWACFVTPLASLDESSFLERWITCDLIFSFLYTPGHREAERLLLPLWHQRRHRRAGRQSTSSISPDTKHLWVPHHHWRLWASHRLHDRGGTMLCTAKL